MKIIKLILLVVAVLLGTELVRAEQTRSAEIAQRFAALINDNQAVTELAGLQVVLIKDGKIVFQHANGMAHLAADNEVTDLTIDHKVRVASISKFVMALGFMSLVEQGKVDLDQDVSEYLGFTLRNPNFPNQIITSKQLLAHTSSIRDAEEYFMPYGADFQDFFRASEYYKNGEHFANAAGQAPGEYFTYSNLNFGILAGIIEMVSGQRFDLFMEQNIFQPLGLNISFNNCRFSNEGHQYIATLYRRGKGGYSWDSDGPWIPQVDDSQRICYYGGPTVSSDVSHTLNEISAYRLGSNPTLFSPQGGLRASAKDLAQLILILSSGKDSKGSSTLSSNTIKQMLTPVWTYDPEKNNGQSAGESDGSDPATLGLMTSYGLSTHIVDFQNWQLTDESSVWYGHLASAYGLLGQLWFAPETQDGIVILLTGMGSDPSTVKKTTPLDEIEAQVLRLALESLEHL